MEKIREIKFNGKILKLLYRDDSDLSVIDEFFVDCMYRALEPIIPSLTDPIVDVGAHIGLFSIYARLLNQTTPIICLEPHPDNFQLLKDNLKLNNIKNATAIHAAIVPGKELNTKLYLSKNTHNHSTMPLSKDCIQVPAISLERLVKENKIKKIGLLKMDIEGAEFETVLNIDNEIWNKIQYAVIEYHESRNNKRADLENIIRQHGFSVEHLPNHFDKRFGLLVCRNKKSSK